MKEFKFEGYKVREYKNEKYHMHVYIEKTHSESYVHSDNWEELYARAKIEIASGNQCEIYELKYEFVD